MSQSSLTSDASTRRATRDGHAPDDDIFRLIIENTIDVIVRGDAARNRVYISPSSREMLGYEPVDMLGKHAYELVHPEDLQRTHAVFARIGPEYPRQDLTFRMRRADASYIWVGATYRYLPEDGGVLAVLRDITARKVAEQRLAEANAQLEAANAELWSLAQVDGLTGLANRRHFNARIDEETRRARRQELPLGLVLFDVDHFKGFNDRYGHLEGDDCLRRVSRCVAECMRRPGDLAARYGGEEIVMLLPDTDTNGAVELAEHVRGCVARLGIEHAGSPLGLVTISGGAAAAKPPSDPAALIKAADVALYQAKAAGRNRVCFCPNGTALAPVQER